MRNSEARRYARWSAILAMVLAALVGVSYLRRGWDARQAEKKAPAAVPATIQERSADFSYSKVDGQRTIFTVRASRATEFKAGSRSLLEDVSIRIYGRSGQRNDTLTTRACDFISTTGKITCAGEVQIRLEAAQPTTSKNNSIEVLTSDLSFERESGLAHTDKPVTFRWPGGAGRSLGTTYDSNEGVLSLDRSVELRLSPGNGVATSNAPVARENNARRLTGDRLVFQRDLQTVQILGSVHAVQDGSELTAQSLSLALDGDLLPRRIVARGRPQLVSQSAEGQRSIVADEMSSQFTSGATSDLSSVLATGHVEAHRKTPAGDDQISAERMQVNLTGKESQPGMVTASGAVVLASHDTSPSAGSRRVETAALEARFAPGAQRGQSLLARVNTTAPARVEWEATSLIAGKPVKQSMHVRGNQMELRFAGPNQSENRLQQVTSSGDVEVRRQVGNAPEQTTISRELTARFSSDGEWLSVDQSGDVHFCDGLRTGQGDAARADRSSRTMTLTGHVALSDKSARTTAESAVFSEGSNELRADGNVITTELRAGTMVDLAPEPAHISARHLVANAAAGHATYSGGSRMWQGRSVMEADTVELDNPSRVVTARGNVRAVFPQAVSAPGATARGIGPDVGNVGNGGNVSRMGDLWHVRGGVLTYWATDARARVEQDASADSSRGSIRARVIDLYFSPSNSVSTPKQLSRAVATGDVAIRQEDRRGTSDRAEYTGSDGKFVLSGGKPTLYDSTGDTTSGRQLTFFFSDDRIVVDSERGSRTVTLHQVEK